MKLTQTYQICHDKKCKIFFSNNLSCKYVNSCKYKTIFILKENFNQKLNGEKHGFWQIYWNQTGTICFEGNFVLGKEEGLHKKWFDFGDQWQISRWKNGKRHGILKEWFSTGDVALEIMYDNGKIIEIKQDNRRS